MMALAIINQPAGNATRAQGTSACCSSEPLVRPLPSRPRQKPTYFLLDRLLLYHVEGKSVWINGYARRGVGAY